MRMVLKSPASAAIYALAAISFAAAAVVAADTMEPSMSPSDIPSCGEPKYRAAGKICLDDYDEEQVICLASEHSSNVAVHCCSGSMDGGNLECSRDGCVKRRTFAEAKAYCEDQDMRLCSLAEVESGACCNQGCGWNWDISWTSDSCGCQPDSPEDGGSEGEGDNGDGEPVSVLSFIICHPLLVYSCFN